MRPPGPALAPFIQSIGYFRSELAHARERLLPGGQMQLLVNLGEDQLRTYHGEDLAIVRRVGGAALQGAFSGHVGIDTDEQRTVIVVTFELGGAFPFFGPPASATRDELVDLELLWGRDGGVLRERLLHSATPERALQTMEEVLLAHVARPLEPDPAVRFAIRALRLGVPVGVVTERLGLTPKRLINRFRDQVGLSPKRFSRIQRFRRVLRSIDRGGPSPDWAQIAATCGYFDQAHLINDFRELSGITPTAYRARSSGEESHVPVTG